MTPTTHPTTLPIWISKQDQTRETAKLYDHAVQFKTDQPVMVELSIYGNRILTRKMYVKGFETDLNNTLYLCFAFRKGNYTLIRPVETVKFIDYAI